MKINEISFNKSVLKTGSKNINQVCFSGLKNPATKCMFVFDLDGTFANGTNDELSKIIEIAKKRTANLIYATGRSKDEVERLQKELAGKGVMLPLPDYLVSNNGQFIYDNIDGILVKNTQYERELKLKTNFNSKEVFEIMQNLANFQKYKFNQKQLTELRNLNNFKAIKSSDPIFYESKLSYYEWNHSEFMSEWFVSADVNLPQLKKDIQAELDKFKVKTKFIENRYSKKIMDCCRESILLQSNSIRRFNDGSMTALFLCPADKADGVKFLKKQLDVPFNEILMAGNDDNDISMAKLSRKGASFICVNNASQALKQISIRFMQVVNTLFMAQNNGAKGILDGMSKIIE